MKTVRVQDWGFGTAANGELAIAGVPARELAEHYGTPLHVIDEAGLEGRARRIARAFADAYPGEVRLHFATKCNDTPGVVGLVLGAGLALEVGTPYEWWLALKLGARPAELIVNGPLKGALLETAFRAGAGLVVLDGLDEMDLAARLAGRLGVTPRVLLRVNPNCIPRGMNRATATGSRKLSMFGLDLATGEVERACAAFSGSPLRYAGLHCHVGSGLREPRDYCAPIARLVGCAARAAEAGLVTEVIDLGGGIGVPTSRELTTREYLLYHALGRLPPPCDARRFPPVEQFADVIARAMMGECARHRLPLPALRLEPGRVVASGAGVLLVTVGRIKARKGVGTWAIADGGAGTVAFPLFYELHEILHCRAPEAAATHRYDLVGGACFSADWLYRGKRLPELRVGDVLAVCDAGAYFSVQESNFGFAHPAIVGVRAGGARLLRRRETFSEMVGRDAVMEEVAGRFQPPLVPPPAVAPADAPEGLRFRRLTSVDTEEAAAILGRSFDRHALYAPALGLERTSFHDYFRLLIPLALADSRGLVLGAEWRGKLAAVLIAARPGFPALGGGLRHLRDFARVAGWRGLLRYVHFSFSLERFLQRPKSERAAEFRGLWLGADARISGRRAGVFLVRAACDFVRRLGYPLVAAVVDARDRPLIALYERYGFKIEPGTSFLGGRAVRMERWSA